MDDWKLTLLVSFVSLCNTVFNGDIASLLLFCGFYYIALVSFDAD